MRINEYYLAFGFFIGGFPFPYREGPFGTTIGALTNSQASPLAYFFTFIVGPLGSCGFTEGFLIEGFCICGVTKLPDGAGSIDGFQVGSILLISICGFFTLTLSACFNRSITDVIPFGHTSSSQFPSLYKNHPVTVPIGSNIAHRVSAILTNNHPCQIEPEALNLLASLSAFIPSCFI